MTKQKDKLQKQIDLWYSYYVSGKIQDSYPAKEYYL